MNFKVSALIIVLSTLGLIGLLNLVMSKSTTETTVAVKEAQQNLNPPQEKESVKNTAKPLKIEPKAAKPMVDEAAHTPELAKAQADLSEDDVKKIMGVARLSDSELKREIETLKDQIEDDDLFELLEEGELSAEKEQEAKDLLERFALLGLEETRRKFMDKEPELKDALYAHKDSLKEIRELLSDEE